MIQDSEKTIADIVRSDYRTADVFKKYHINFCCSGKISLHLACELQHIDYHTIQHELEEAARIIQLPGNLQYDQWKVDFLVDYIANVHHAYLYQAIPALRANLVSFLEGHKKKFPALIDIYEVFHELSDLLERHNRHEDEIIFPYIKQIESAHRRKEPYGNLFVRTLRKPLSHIGKEHVLISELLTKLKMHTNNYTYPANACTNHQVIYHKLNEFHQDTVQHIHLENDILFPKALEIEQHLLKD